MCLIEAGSVHERSPRLRTTFGSAREVAIIRSIKESDCRLCRSEIVGLRGKCPVVTCSQIKERETERARRRPHHAGRRVRQGRAKKRRRKKEGHARTEAEQGLTCDAGWEREPAGMHRMHLTCTCLQTERWWARLRVSSRIVPASEEPYPRVGEHVHEDEDEA